jgi:hypothetical protein
VLGKEKILPGRASWVQETPVELPHKEALRVFAKYKLYDTANLWKLAALTYNEMFAATGGLAPSIPARRRIARAVKILTSIRGRCSCPSAEERSRMVTIDCSRGCRQLLWIGDLVFDNVVDQTCAACELPGHNIEEVLVSLGSEPLGRILLMARNFR